MEAAVEAVEVEAAVADPPAEALARAVSAEDGPIPIPPAATLAEEHVPDLARHQHTVGITPAVQGSPTHPVGGLPVALFLSSSLSRPSLSSLASGFTARYTHIHTEARTTTAIRPASTRPSM